MRILLVADGRSPITKRWVGGLNALQHKVVIVSTFPCEEIPGVETLYILPLAFSGLAGSQVNRKPVGEPSVNIGSLRSSVSRSRFLLQRMRYWFGPLTVRYYAARFRKIVTAEAPDLIHALRIPFEGMLAATAPQGIPVLASIWGNDLTLHAVGSRGMRRWTEQVLARVDGLLADAHRDIRLAQQWGYLADKPTLVVPGSGGIDLDEICRIESDQPGLERYGVSASEPFIVNPRGFRPGSVRNDVFFQSIPLILERHPKVKFLCLAMQGQEEAMRWVQRLNIGAQVRLLPYLSQPELWQLFQNAKASVSISSHDGTPNSLLEAMACGCFPIVGDIESLREWIIPGVNGLLVEPGKPQDVAEAVSLALNNDSLREQAAVENGKIIRERCEVDLVRERVDTFYNQILNQ